MENGSGEKIGAGLVHDCLLHVVALTGDDLILQFFTDRGKVGVITGDAYQQVPVILRVFLGIPQHIRIQHIDLQSAAAIFDISAQERFELLAVFRIP